MENIMCFVCSKCLTGWEILFAEVMDHWCNWPLVVWASIIHWFYYFLHFGFSEIIAFPSYLPVIPALPVTSASGPLPLDYSICLCLWWLIVRRYLWYSQNLLIILSTRSLKRRNSFCCLLCIQLLICFCLFHYYFIIHH